MNNKKGFLLLEVMVSIVIITSGLLFVTRVYSTARDVIKRSFVLFKSSLLLEDKMFEFEEKGEKNKDSATTTHPDMTKHLGATCIAAAHHYRNVYIQPCGCSRSIHNVFTKNF